MSFYLEMPKDEYFNTGHPYGVIEGDPEVYEASPGLGPQIKVTAPASFAKRWPTVLAMHGWVEVEGPARSMEYEEYRAYIVDLINRNPAADHAGMVTLKDGSRSPLAVARVCLFALRSLLRDAPLGVYELVMATRDEGHTFFGQYAGRLRERGLLNERDRPHGALRSVILNAVVGEAEQMRLVNPERPR
jgi:hypothetical protein